ncbi:MAG: methyltransferase regulatory domain-containing protein [Desulfamplus sp.]|nr:methyltransferase regulatory domain-containing protein [Desulfamplus sp.]
MSDWTSGYVTDIGYTYGYYTELNPLVSRMAFLNAGLVFPDGGNACELAFGQGISVNINAAAGASRWKWYGTDFNPLQAGFGRELATVSGSGANLYDHSFAEFCNRDDLPEFDFIGMHGTWSWISDENRSIIVDFLRRKLKVGGVFYVSYNTQPGWATIIPLRDLFVRHAEVMGSKGQGSVSRVDGALAFAEKLMAANPLYSRFLPQVNERLKKMKEQNRNYLAHEYFNQDWEPMSVDRMADWLTSAKMTYACSAHFFDHVDALNLSSDQQALLQQIPDPIFREMVRDFCVNQQFRRDYWVKGARRLFPLEQAEKLLDQKVVMVKPRANISLKINGALGEAEMQKAIYLPVLEALEDYQPKTLGQIEQAVRDKGVQYAQAVQAVMVLVGNGAVLPAQDPAEIKAAKKHTEKINRYLIDKARFTGDISFLASPVTGGAVAVGRFQQLFMLAINNGKKNHDEWAAFAWNILAAQNQRVIKDGKVLEKPEENLEELTEIARVFAQRQLPVVKQLIY